MNQDSDTLCADVANLNANLTTFMWLVIVGDSQEKCQRNSMNRYLFVLSKPPNPHCRQSRSVLSPTRSGFLFQQAHIGDQFIQIDLVREIRNGFLENEAK